MVRYQIIKDYFNTNDEEREPISFYWGTISIDKGGRNYWDVE
jgi:hypothetical protein